MLKIRLAILGLSCRVSFHWDIGKPVISFFCSYLPGICSSCFLTCDWSINVFAEPTSRVGLKMESLWATDEGMYLFCDAGWPCRACCGSCCATVVPVVFYTLVKPNPFQSLLELSYRCGCYQHLITWMFCRFLKISIQGVVLRRICSGCRRLQSLPSR